MEVKSSWNRWHHQRQFPHSRFVDVHEHGHHHHRHHHHCHNFPHHQNHGKKHQKQWFPAKRHYQSTISKIRPLLQSKHHYHHQYHHHYHHHHYNHDQEIARDETVSKATAAAAQGVNRRRSNVVKEVKIITMIIMLIKTITIEYPHIFKSSFQSFQVERLKENREKRRAQQAQILEDQEVGASMASLHVL